MYFICQVAQLLIVGNIFRWFYWYTNYSALSMPLFFIRNLRFWHSGVTSDQGITLQQIKSRLVWYVIRHSQSFCPQFSVAQKLWIFVLISIIPKDFINFNLTSSYTHFWTHTSALSNPPFRESTIRPNDEFNYCASTWTIPEQVAQVMLGNCVSNLGSTPNRLM